MRYEDNIEKLVAVRCWDRWTNQGFGLIVGTKNLRQKSKPVFAPLCMDSNQAERTPFARCLLKYISEEPLTSFA